MLTGIQCKLYYIFLFNYYRRLLYIRFIMLLSNPIHAFFVYFICLCNFDNKYYLNQLLYRSCHNTYIYIYIYILYMHQHQAQISGGFGGASLSDVCFDVCIDLVYPLLCR